VGAAERSGLTLVLDERAGRIWRIAVLERSQMTAPTTA
jgi:hypothetical protein